MMGGVKIWLVMVTVSGLCVVGWSNQHANDTRISRKKSVHVHQHNGDITSKNATNIIREEGRYFLKKLFLEYGSGDQMNLVGLEKLLVHVGYHTEEHTSHEHKDQEHGDNSPQYSEHSEHGRDESKHISKNVLNMTKSENSYVRQDGNHMDMDVNHDNNSGNEDDEHEQEGNRHVSEHVHDENTGNEGITHTVDTKLKDHHHNYNQGENSDRKRLTDSKVSESKHGDQDHEEQGEYGDHEEQGEYGDHEERGEYGDHEEQGEYGDHEEQGEYGDHEGQGEYGDHEEQDEYGDHEEQDEYGDHEEQDEYGDQDHEERGKHDHIHHGEQNGHSDRDYNKQSAHKQSVVTEHGDNNRTKHSEQDHSEHGHDGDYMPNMRGELGDRNSGEQGKHKSSIKSRKRHKTHSKSRKTRRNKKKSGRASRKKKVGRDKRSTMPVIFHTHDLHSDCLSVRELLKIFHFDEKNQITKRDFLYISPAIIYQLDKPQCRRQQTIFSHDHTHGRRVQSRGISGRVWGYSIAAVVVISLVGLLGVAVIPIMQRIFYNQLLQFLVAMAVGALTGDAMLHLLPHAIAGEVSVEEGEGADHDHSGSVWKGMCGLAGIYFFFLLQRLLTIVSGIRTKRRRRRKDLMLHKASPEGPSVVLKLSSPEDFTNVIPDPNSTEQLTPLKPEGNTKHQEEDDHIEHSHGSHGHSHHDGPMPTSVSAVAWMVILGDGVHNLSDGLAIGAAFASSITGGFSTAIAVFCHELPHEIGDFAVLLKSGMSVKQAVLYNVLSSVLCFIGMLIGVALGNIHEASTWIFAGVGGMFIYISLVTMVPELTSVDSQKPFRDLILQCSGICVGSGIMLAIAVYEKDLMTILD